MNPAEIIAAIQQTYFSSRRMMGRGVAGYGFESGAGEGGGVSGVGRCWGFVGVEWVGFEGGGFGAFCGLDGCFDQRGGDALSAVADADVEA